MTFDPELVIPAVVSLLAMTHPFNAVKVIVFNSAISNPPRDRMASAARVAIYVALILGTTALFGRALLDVLGIDLNAFRVVGGLIITALGVEMLYGGGSTHSNDGEVREQGPNDTDALMIPLAMPLIAGPGSIATTLTIASQGDDGAGVAAALIAIGVVALVAFVAYAAFGEALAKIRPATLAIVSRLGGLLMMTIGAQMLLGAIKVFFA